MSGTNPAATAAAEPPEEPPATRVEIVRIPGGSVVRVFGGEPVSELIHVERAYQHRPGVLQRADSIASRVAAGASRRIIEPASVRALPHRTRFFTANGTPASGPRIFTARDRLVHARRIGHRALWQNGRETVQSTVFGGRCVPGPRASRGHRRDRAGLNSSRNLQSRSWLEYRRPLPRPGREEIPSEMPPLATSRLKSSFTPGRNRASIGKSIFAAAAST